MKGLLLKDLFNLRRIMKQYFFVAALMFVWSVFLKNQMLFSMIMIMYSMMMLLTTMSFDESSQFNKYALTMPVTRRELAGEKYILMLLLMLAGVAVGFVGGGILSLFSSEEISWLSAENLVSIAAVSGVYVLGFSVLLPMIFKYGVEKSHLSACFRSAIWNGFFYPAEGACYFRKSDHDTCRFVHSLLLCRLCGVLVCFRSHYGEKRVVRGVRQRIHKILRKHLEKGSGIAGSFLLYW